MEKKNIIIKLSDTNKSYSIYCKTKEGKYKNHSNNIDIVTFEKIKKSSAAMNYLSELDNNWFRKYIHLKIDIFEELMKKLKKGIIVIGNNQKLEEKQFIDISVPTYKIEKKIEGHVYLLSDGKNKKVFKHHQFSIKNFIKNLQYKYFYGITIEDRIQNEISASKINNYLGFNCTPKTVEKYTFQGKEGLLSDFIENGVQMPLIKWGQFNKMKNTKYFRSYTQNLLFQYIINAVDAHGENFLRTKDGIIGIDNEASFYKSPLGNFFKGLAMTGLKVVTSYQIREIHENDYKKIIQLKNDLNIFENLNDYQKKMIIKNIEKIENLKKLGKIKIFN